MQPMELNIFSIVIINIISWEFYVSNTLNFLQYQDLHLDDQLNFWPKLYTIKFRSWIIFGTYIIP